MKRRNIWALTLLTISFVCLLTSPDLANAQSTPRLKPIPTRRVSGRAAAALSPQTPSAWQALTNQAPSGFNGIQIMIQETDGTILVQSYDGQTWMKLTPDAMGSYINGTWTTLTPEPIARLYFASQIMPDGRLFVVGGEYSGPGLLPNWSNTGEIYDPLSNTWTPITPYPNQKCFGLNYLSGNTTSGSSQITGIYPYTTGLTIGEGVFGFGIPNPATIVSVDSTSQITISAPATQTTTANFIFLSANYPLIGCLGDDPSTLLSSQKILVGDLLNGNTYIYDAASNAWSPSGTKVYPDDSSDEEGWARISDGTLIAYDLFHSIKTNGSYAEQYHPKHGTWTSISPSDGTAHGTIPLLSSNALGEELGPLLRLQDGRVFAIGATQHTALYNPTTNTWAAGPDISGTLNGIPSPFGADDAPGAVLPNGHVIFAADAGVAGFTSSGNITSGSAVITGIPSTAILQVFWPVNGAGIPGGSSIVSVDSPTQVTINNPATATTSGVAISWGGTFSNPTELFDFDPHTDTITQVTSALPDGNLPFQGSYPSRMLMLPTGQVLFSDASAQLWVYTSSGAPNPSLRPLITDIHYRGNGKFSLTGFQLNGQSAGAAYGDDDQMDANYPIIRMVNSSGNVFYARSSDWNKFGVGNRVGRETVDFTLNPGVTPGDYSLIVSGAGISSFPTFIHITQREVEGGGGDD